MDIEEKDVAVDREQSNAGGPESLRFDKLVINCNLGNHRPQRMYYKRDGTPFECLDLGISTGLLNKQPSRNPRALDVHRDAEQTQQLQQRERDGERVSYSIPDHIFVSVTEVKGEGAFFTFDELNDMFPYIPQEPSILAVDEFKVLEHKDRRHSCFFGPWRSYLNLHDEFAVSIIRSVFLPTELLRMFDTMRNNGRLFFLMPAVTRHLAPRAGEYVLCEVDFENHKIVFYLKAPDSVDTLRFYAECMWSQFVFPAQERQWQVLLFQISAEVSLLPAFVFVIEARTQNKVLHTVNLNSELDFPHERAKTVLRRISASQNLAS